MKTINKVQKTGNQKSNKVMSIVISAVVGLALIGSTEVLTKVKNSKKSFITDAKMEETLQVESWMTNESYFSSLPEISNLEIEKALGYNPEKFVNAEWSIEKEMMMNANNEEVLKADLALEAETLTNESGYNAAKFVKDEIEIEYEKVMNNENFLEEAEALTANGSELEVAKYAQKQINASETEPALKMEAWMTDKNFFLAAEVYTANGSELEVEKYAEKQIIRN